MARSAAYPVVVGVVALIAGADGAAQGADRPMQQGTKTVPAMYVAYLGRTSGPGEVEAQISQTLGVPYEKFLEYGQVGRENPRCE